MGLIRIGIALILIGILLSLTGLFEFGGALRYVGWIALVIGVVLAVVHYATGGRSTA